MDIGSGCRAGSRGRGTPTRWLAITKAGQIGGVSPIGVPVGRDHPDNLYTRIGIFKKIYIVGFRAFY